MVGLAEAAIGGLASNDLLAGVEHAIADIPAAVGRALGAGGANTRSPVATPSASRGSGRRIPATFMLPVPSTRARPGCRHGARP